MLTVAPIGRTKELTRLETPTLFSTALMVTGRVAPDELVEKAITIGSTMFLKCTIGLIPPRKRRMSGRVRNRCIVRPQTSIRA